ncbi:hypothetical protein OSB04_027875 [Centaurea solstitialis]|uniref:Reverse transcriptase domain-containing protein n=1 Tax=Centaurea solstitialis TaxID=347529 RepID=A0AA38W8P6_9ASTR|nr:hypothetical protein OSB04_027875 [Centaurea solstitialis]
MFLYEKIFRCLCGQVDFELDLIPGASILFRLKRRMAMWMCIDYRELNKLTVENRYPLSRINDLFDQLLGTAWSPKIDLRSGYHQVTVIGKDVLKTTSSSRYGCFEFVVMMFALANAPTVFMDLMNRVCGPKLDGSIIVITHDILIYSKIKGEHANFGLKIRDVAKGETWDLKTDYGWPGLKRVVARYVKEMMARHGVLVTEVSDREERFISRFWGRFYEGMGTRLQFCTAFYPHIDGQNERARQTLEIMLRACVLDFWQHQRSSKDDGGHGDDSRAVTDRSESSDKLRRQVKLRKCLVDESDHIPTSDIQMGELWEANCRVGKEDQNVAEKRDGTSESPMGTSQGVRLDVGVKRRDDYEFPELF